MSSKRFFICTAALLLAVTPALAELKWPAAASASQSVLMQYVDRVNDDLGSLQAEPVTHVLECYATTASLAIAESDDPESPHRAEITVMMDGTTLSSLVLRTASAELFPKLAAACLHAAAPENDLTDALADPQSYANTAKAQPDNSFEDPINDLPGETLRSYYAYYPDQYHDGVNWLQLTLIFPMNFAFDAGVSITPEPTLPPDGSTEYEGYFAQDDHPHLEIFLQATPEPDSPAGDRLNNNP